MYTTTYKKRLYYHPSSKDEGAVSCLELLRINVAYNEKYVQKVTESIKNTIPGIEVEGTCKFTVSIINSVYVGVAKQIVIVKTEDTKTIRKVDKIMYSLCDGYWIKYT